MVWSRENPQGNEAGRVIWVYGLKASDRDCLRYIGQTSQRLAKRLDSHLHCPKSARRRRVSKWIGSVLRRGAGIILVPLYENAVWNETEQDLIRIHREMGFDLVNATDGGDGVLHRVWTPEQRAKQSAKRKGMKFSVEHRDNIARARRGTRLSEITRARVSAALKGRMPKNLLLVQASVRGKPKSAAHRAKLSAALKGRDVRKEAGRGMA